MRLFPCEPPVGTGFQAANTENLAFLPLAVPWLAPINRKLSAAGRWYHYLDPITRVPLREFHVGER